MLNLIHHSTFIIPHWFMAAIFSALDTEAYDRQYSDAQLVRRIGAYLQAQRRRVLGIVAFTTAVALVDV
ncbi:MAG: hypothetical protein AAB427_14475, partial [Chloroflexota bacterium]